MTTHFNRVIVHKWFIYVIVILMLLLLFKIFIIQDHLLLLYYSRCVLWHDHIGRIEMDHLKTCIYLYVMSCDIMVNLIKLDAFACRLKMLTISAFHVTYLIYIIKSFFCYEFLLTASVLRYVSYIISLEAVIKSMISIDHWMRLPKFCMWYFQSDFSDFTFMLVILKFLHLGPVDN